MIRLRVEEMGTMVEENSAGTTRERHYHRCVVYGQTLVDRNIIVSYNIVCTFLLGNNKMRRKNYLAPTQFHNIMLKK